MKQFLLATCLIIAPVGVFSGAYKLMVPAAEAADQSLGDMSSFKIIISDVQAIAATGDFTKAEKRITDFETAWDEGQDKLRPMNKAAWSNVDDASDAALHALRKSPEIKNVDETLKALMAALQYPLGGDASSSNGVKQGAGIAVTDETGHALPCEAMLKDVTAALTAGKISDANKKAVTDIQAKATERCNADDDAHADEFSAQALALVGK